MAKFALILLSILSTSAFATEMVTEAPQTIIVRGTQDANSAEYVVTDLTSEDAIKELAATSEFTALTNTADELDRETGVASFYFQWNYTYYNPWINYYGYRYNYSYAWNWGSYYYRCYRLGWWY